MKLLILTLCVAAASAAAPPPGAYQPFPRALPSWQQRSAQAQAQVVPVVKNVPEVVVTRASAGVVGSEVNAEVLRSDVEVKPDGFSYTYETQNGINAQASGALKKVEDTEAVVVEGSYKYVAPDGTPFAVSYIADENGFQPQGDHLPVPPPIPPVIQRSLEWISAHSPPAVVVAGQKY